MNTLSPVSRSKILLWALAINFVLVPFTFLIGLGVPNEIAEYDDYITVLPQDQIPSVEDATEYYESQGGHLRIESNFGVDPLATRLDLILLRDQLLFNRLPSNADMFSDVVSGNGHLLKIAILECIEVTNRFTLLI